MKYSTPLAIGSILGPDTSSMSFYKASTNSQPQANSATASLSTTLHLIKAIENPVSQVDGNTWACISNVYGKPGLFCRLRLTIGIGSRNLDHGSRTTIPSRIFEKITQDNLNPSPINIEQWDFFR